MSDPLIRLTGIGREYRSAGEPVVALADIDLTIEAGEMVAIVGASGSGKSTLMNILGCLDRPTSGRYEIAGRDMSMMDPNELARMRREHFGFIFQRYHLMPELDALANVELPAIYAGWSLAARRERSAELLRRIGLGDRARHRPAELSGGQQQRVSIARALMNGGDIVLADEPTGALDRRSGTEMLRILDELSAEGHTIIIVTHDMAVARHARRIVEISDGRIVADEPNPAAGSRPSEKRLVIQRRNESSGWRATVGRLEQAARMAMHSMRARPMRAFLTMLGIIIGVTSVLLVVALGAGAQRSILADISAIGTSTIDIFPGKGFGDEKSASIQTLKPGDAEALAQQPYVDSVTPTISTSVSVRFTNISATGSVTGVGDSYFRVKGIELAKGRGFDADGVVRAAQEVVIDDNTRRELFRDWEQPLGQVILLGAVPAQIVGVIEKKDSAFGEGSQNLSLFVPYTMVMSRMLGRSYLQGITVRLKDGTPSAVAEDSIARLLATRHGARDVTLLSSDSIRQTIERTTQTLTLLIAAIAVISLVVGGIGVMNIMLVTVTERTQEIGVRTAIGARRSDILSQFLIEAVLLCIMGGIIGVALATGLVSLAGPLTSGQFVMRVSPTSVVLAVSFSTLIGVAFGFFPARDAALLDPVEALARE